MHGSALGMLTDAREADVKKYHLRMSTLEEQRRQLDTCDPLNPGVRPSDSSVAVSNSQGRGGSSKEIKSKSDAAVLLEANRNLKKMLYNGAAIPQIKFSEKMLLS